MWSANSQSDPISGSFSGSTTVYANQITDPQNQQTVIFTNGPFDPAVSDSTGSATADGSNSFSVSPEQLDLSFDGDLRISGQTGALPAAGVGAECTFVLSSTEYVVLTGKAQISKSPVTSVVTFQPIQLGNSPILLQYGQGNVNPGTQSSGSFTGFLQAGTYRLSISVEVGASAAFTSAESFEADYNGSLYVGDYPPPNPDAPEPSTWIGVLLGAFVAALARRKTVAT
jgi:hypothetical protein